MKQNLAKFPIVQPQKQPQNSTVGRTGSLRKAFTTSEDEEEEYETELLEKRPLQRPLKNSSNQNSHSAKNKQNVSQSSTSDYHSDENPNLLPVEHRELPNFSLHQLNSR